MRDKTKKTIEFIVSIIIIAILFLLVSYYVQQYINELKPFIKDNYFLGIFIYFLIEVASIVLAPLTSIPLIPLMSQVYEPFLTAVVSLVSWVFGSVVAFFIARRYGKELVSKFVSLKEVEAFEKILPKGKSLFWTLIGLRIFVPSDILSYSLGVLTKKINYKLFTITAIIGSIPTTFALAYLGAIPFTLQVIFTTIGAVIFMAVAFYIVKQVYD